MDKLIEQIFNEFILEAEDGININDINIKFRALEKYTINSSYNDGIPVLIIKNKKELINKLKQYIELVLTNDFEPKEIKKALIFLFANACYEDFSNPIKFIDNHINFYLNNDFLEDEKQIEDISIKQEKQTLSGKAPYIFKSEIKEDNYLFPKIEFGISENICYLFNIQEENKKEKNKDIDEKYNPTLLSLSLLIKELYDYGISKLKVVSFLPMRDNNTSKLLDSFNSLSYLFSNIKVCSYPFEQDEYMNVEVNEFILEEKNWSSILLNEEITINKKI